MPDLPIDLVIEEEDVPAWCGLHQCPSCEDARLEPEHAHYRCPSCGYRGACCW